MLDRWARSRYGRRVYWAGTRLGGAADRRWCVLTLRWRIANRIAIWLQWIGEPPRWGWWR